MPGDRSTEEWTVYIPAVDFSIISGGEHDVAAGGVIHVSSGTPLQTVNHGEEELLVYVHGYPPESKRAELLDSDVTA
jgi:quercetin dioxygenase-like cupin family protein